MGATGIALAGGDTTTETTTAAEAQTLCGGSADSAIYRIPPLVSIPE
jgi:hypothetical protein